MASQIQETVGRAEKSWVLVIDSMLSEQDLKARNAGHPLGEGSSATSPTLDFASRKGTAEGGLMNYLFTGDG